MEALRNLVKSFKENASKAKRERRSAKTYEGQQRARARENTWTHAAERLEVAIQDLEHQQCMTSLSCE